MDGHYWRFRALECHLAGICPLAMAGGNQGEIRVDVFILVNNIELMLAMLKSFVVHDEHAY